jgi:hypothetical protein
LATTLPVIVAPSSITAVSPAAMVPPLQADV